MGMGGAGVGGGGALLPDSASSPWSDPSVDLDVVDYVLRKPFSDESFRLLLEAAEADHLQVHAGERRHSRATAFEGSLVATRIVVLFFVFYGDQKRNYDRAVSVGVYALFFSAGECGRLSWRKH